MAEIILKKDSKRRKLPVPRIDLTPMVDLGFLLITFFMYTTTLAKPNSMALNMPDKGDNTKHQAWPEESTITLIPSRDGTVFYYKGAFEDKKMEYVNERGLRGMLSKEVVAARTLPTSFSKDAHKLHVIIKPTDESKYDQLIMVLDEMRIMDVPFYAVMDISAEEKEIVTKKLQNNL